MAKAIATCKCEKCGKEFIVTAFKNSRREADNFVDWAERNITECNECKKEAVEDNGPELTGSEKQISWAKDIRANLVNATKAFAAKADNKELAESFIAWVVAGKTDARFWIDNRNLPNLFYSEAVQREYLEKKGA